MMWKVLARARHRFAREQGGNVAILFAFTAIPMIGLLGGAVDVTRHNRHETAILNAMDSAAVALVKRGARDDAEADVFVNNYINALLPSTRRDAMLHLAAFDATEIPGGWRIESKGQMETAFLPVVGIDEMPLDLQSEVMSTGGSYEIALALDNTGSMAERNKIRDLREAATTLVDMLYEEEGAAERVKMALIPFTTTVNIRGAAFDPAWLDPTGEGLGDHQFDNFDVEVSRLDIFSALGRGRRGPDGLPVAWTGCVEARVDGYDVDDTAPGEDPVTRWTPYLSPDGADAGGGPASANSYLEDASSRGSARDRMRDVEKYVPPEITERFDEETGPNQACRGPIVELTNDQDRMRDAIDAMEPGGFTHIPEGLAWGWRVLSPGEPFSQGAEYDDETTQKVLVLLSDGVNTIPGTYTSYGYLEDGRLGTRNANRAKLQLDANVTTLCEQVKALNIRLYMILFQENDRATQRIFEDCASINEKTGEPYYYYAPNGAALTAAFAGIGNDLTNIRITR
jgi:Flp pilus assembly protein TadG